MINGLLFESTLLPMKFDSVNSDKSFLNIKKIQIYVNREFKSKRSHRNFKETI